MILCTLPFKTFTRRSVSLACLLVSSVILPIMPLILSEVLLMLPEISPSEWLKPYISSTTALKSIKSFCTTSFTCDISPASSSYSSPLSSIICVINLLFFKSSISSRSSLTGLAKREPKTAGTIPETKVTTAGSQPKPKEAKLATPTPSMVKSEVFATLFLIKPSERTLFSL